MRASIFTLFLAVVSVNACTYKNRECPDYVVKEKHADYEIRSYPSLTWVTATEKSNFKTLLLQSKTFMRLFKYISGENDRGVKIEMTAPVRIKTSESNGQSKMEMSFLVLGQYAENTPIPNDKNITISHESQVEYAVSQFSGYVWRYGTWDKQAQILSKSLEHDDSFDKTWFYQVMYNSPFELFDRRNEIWMSKKTQEEASEI